LQELVSMATRQGPLRAGRAPRSAEHTVAWRRRAWFGGCLLAPPL
jgi:hypothetical protein